MITKICKGCGIEKDSTHYHKDKSSRDGLRTYCIPCNNERGLLWYNNNRDRAIKTHRELHYIKSYGISYTEFIDLAKSQDNKCPICLSELDFSKKLSSNKAVMDHCHTSLKNRQVLCSGCNTGLGKFNDDIDTLKRAIDYLEKHK